MSNQSTYYEVWIEWANVGTNQKHIAVAQPVIAVNGWNATPAPAAAICVSDIPGSLINTSVAIKNTKFSTSGTYYVDIQ
jgi:hypothetical protein